MRLLNPLSQRRTVDPSPTRTSARQWLWLARVVVVVALVVVGYKLVRAGLYGLAGYSEAQRVLALRRDGDLDQADLLQVQAATNEIYRSVAGLEQEMRFFAPALHSLRILPGIGPTLAATPELLRSGRELVAVADGVMRLTVPAVQSRPDDPMPALLLAAMAASPDQFVYLGTHADAAQRTLATIPADRLIGRLAEPVAQAQIAVGLLADGLQMAPVLPKLLGFDGPRTYLLLVQNNQELRATGGFISAVGRVTVDRGAFQQIDITDSYNIARDDVDHPWAPEPQQRYMKIPLVFLRDANWSPDFPTTAQLARSLYAQDAGTQVDGIATIDLRAVQLLVGALGPLHVDGADAPVTGENIIEQVQRFWDRPPDTDATLATDDAEWWKQRKDFMPILAKAALGRLESGSFSPLAFAAAVWTALDERDIQVWMADADAAELLAGLHWDGSLQPEPGADYIALVDTNMGYNKVDAVLARAVRYTVTWPEGPGQPAQATLTATYRHPLSVPGHVCDSRSEYGETYSDMIERCYFDYVRLYVPLGSELVSITGVEADSVNSQPGERGTQVFAGYFSLAPGGEHTVTVTYRLPSSITPASYRLVVQRQSGTGPLPVEVSVGDAEMSTTLAAGRLVWAPVEE